MNNIDFIDSINLPISLGILKLEFMNTDISDYLPIKVCL